MGLSSLRGPSESCSSSAPAGPVPARVVLPQFTFTLCSLCIYWFGFFLGGLGGEKGLPSKGLNRGVNNKARRLRALTCAIYLGHQTRTISLRSCGR